MSDRLPKSPPIEEIITEGPVLCLDIDGVCTPLQWKSYGTGSPQEDYRVIEAAGYTMSVHKDLPRWIEHLDEAFARCVWISTWAEQSAEFAVSAGLTRAIDWPYILHDLPDKPLDVKTKAIFRWVARDVPMVVIDDHVFEGMHSHLLLDEYNPTPLLYPIHAHKGLQQDCLYDICQYADGTHRRGGYLKDL